MSVPYWKMIENVLYCFLKIISAQRIKDLTHSVIATLVLCPCRPDAMDDSSDDEDEEPPSHKVEDSESDMETDAVTSHLDNDDASSSSKPQSEVTAENDLLALDSVKPTDFDWLSVWLK